MPSENYDGVTKTTVTGGNKDSHSAAGPSTAGLTAVIYVLQLLIVVGKLLPAIMTFMAALNGILAAYNFTKGEIGWAIFHTVFAVLSIAFLLQIYQGRNNNGRQPHHRGRGYRYYNDSGAKEEEGEQEKGKGAHRHPSGAAA